MSFVCFLLLSPLRLSVVSVVFDFSDSLNDVVPLSPIPLSVDILKTRHRDLLVNVLSSQSIEWALARSPTDDAHGFPLCVFFCLHYLDQVQ